MVINLTVSPKLILRLIRSVEQFAADYRRVHATELQDAPPLDSNVGKFYYADDRKLWEAEHSDQGTEVV